MFDLIRDQHGPADNAFVDQHGETGEASLLDLLGKANSFSRQGVAMANGMRSWTILLLPLCSYSWWCETSNRTGCRGQLRHFVREASASNPFLAYTDIKTSPIDDPIVVDWDLDGVLEVILRTEKGLLLFDFKEGNHFVQMEPSGFESIPPLKEYCRPAVVDWNQDEKPDLVIGAKDGIQYYERIFGGALQQRTGEDNPFRHIKTKGDFCSDLSFADWDGDGDWDLLVSDLFLPMQYFENHGDGRLSPVHEERNPFRHILQNTTGRRPLMVDWNGDKRMDLLLLPKIWNRLEHADNFIGHKVDLYEQSDSGELLLSSDPLLRNKGCSNFTGSGVSLADLDHDGDLDVVFGAFGAPLHVFERTPSGWRAPSAVNSSSIPLDMIELDIDSSGENYLHPSLVDWDLDGDLDLALLHDSPLSQRHRYFEHQSDGTVKEINSTTLSSSTSLVSCPIDWTVQVSFTDFDRDGKKDLVGFHSTGIVLICKQTSSGFDLVPADMNPFYSGPKRSECFLNSSDLCPWDNEFSFGRFHWGGFPSFVDWDSDGDTDMLRINGLNQVYLYEQLPNFTFLPQPLPVPAARDHTAADFDGDGDIDIMISVPNSDQFLYFERRGDGRLERHFGTDNPFNAVGKAAHSEVFGKMGKAQPRARSTLGDWDGDGEADLIVVDESKVTLWINRLTETFVEVAGKENPFGQLGFSDPTTISLVNVSESGILDIVAPRLHGPLSSRNGSFVYFRHHLSGDLVEQHGAENPFQGLDFPDYYKEMISMDRTFVVDFDADGDLDIISQVYQKPMDGTQASDRLMMPMELAYRRNDEGRFKDISPEDPAYPFRGIEGSRHSHWTFADWDHDGDLDFIQTFLPFRSIKIVEQQVQVILEMKRNGTHQAAINAWMEDAMAVKIRFFRQDRAGPHGSNVTFSELTGPANPFRHINGLGIDFASPAVVDLNHDGEWDLVVANKNGLKYFEQLNGTFQRSVASPFRDISIYMGQFALSPVPIFADWDGDGSTDLVLTGTDKVQYFQRGVCTPSSPYCQQGTCSKQTSQCDCIPGTEGPDCSLCGEFHVRDAGTGTCRKCPGYDSLAGTCSRRGVCEDDVDARAKQSASGSTAISATGSGSCTCSEPFYGKGCEHGGCPPGQRLDRDAEVDNRTEKYPKWEACVPCQSGKFKNYSGTEDCSTCPGGYVPVNGTSCFPCENGTFPSPDHNNEICVSCVTGSVAIAGSPLCTACEAGFEPNEDKSLCIPCPTGWYAGPRSAKCNPCGEGSVPEPGKSSCKMCTGQMYAQPGDEVCRKCTFPSMILGEDNRCTPLYTALFLLAFFLLLFFVLAVFGRLRLHCLKRHLNKLVAGKDWEELHSTQATLFEFGLWKHQACKEVSACKQKVKSQSFQLGISLQYVFERLEDVYKDIAQKAEWRLDEWGPVTNSGYLVKARNCGLQLLDAVAAWDALPTCEYPKNPNFHQVAGLLAYGPLALGKHLCCPRDGQPDCSIVDALQAESSSAKATWFLSWVWGYSFSTVYKALTRWWERHRIISGASLEDGIYMWWCVFVNNQFRMLEAGLVEEPGDLFDVFGQQLEGIGKMLMCLDSMSSGQYTSRIWCIFEVFVACQRSIPTTVILPELEVGAVASVKDLTRECKVDAEQAKASVQKDADAIKKHIKEKHQSFEYVNRTVEHALWCEVIEYLERSESAQPSHESTSTGPATTLTESDVSMEKSEMPSAHAGKCILQ